MTRYSLFSIPESQQSFQPVHCPWDRSVLAEIGYINEDVALRLITSLRPSTRSALERAQILEKVAKKLEERHEFHAEWIAKEGGKPLRDARVEVTRAANTFRLCAREAVTLQGQQIPMLETAAAEGRLALTVREPIGPVLAISAFNHPVNLIAHQVGPAFAVGCPVAIKPAAETPISCWYLLQYFYEEGVTAHEIAMLLCETAVTEKLVRHPQWAALNFIGSARVGWHLRSIVAPGVRVALEHGGTAPVIVDDSVDLAKIIPALVKGGYYHAGQVCVSVQRVYVHARIAKEFCARLVKAVQALHTGPATEEKTDCGPLIRPKDVARVHEWVQEALAAGAECLCGGKPLGETSYAPTVLKNVPRSTRAMSDEIFGPVVCVNEFTNLALAVQETNDVRWSFQSSIFTQNLTAALTAARDMEAATVLVNDPSTFRVDWMPFGGRRQSGLGVGGIPATVHEYTQEKLIVLNT